MSFCDNQTVTVGAHFNYDSEYKSVYKYTSSTGYIDVSFDFRVPDYYNLELWESTTTPYFSCGNCIFVQRTNDYYIGTANWIYVTFRLETDRDLDDDGIDDNVERSIAEKFKPVLHRHYYDTQSDLANMDFTLNEYSTLIGKDMTDNGNEIRNADVPPLHVYDPNRSGDWDSFGKGDHIANWKVDIENTARNLGAPPGERPLYFHVYDNSDGYYYLQYWYFFNMNDLTTRGQTKNKTWHEGDWEHVSLKLEKNENYTPVEVNFYQHYGGHTKTRYETWWSSTNNPSYTGIQQGYDENHTHLHIWIAANAHASYNRYDLVYHLEVEGGFDSFTDNVDYSPSGYDLYFTYDYLDKMGEITVCQGCSYHSQTWLEHRAPKGQSKEWLAFAGYFGDWWKRTTPPVTHTYSPKSPANNPYWRNFTSNSTVNGFGNTLGFFEDLVTSITWVLDPLEGDSPESDKPTG